MLHVRVATPDDIPALAEFIHLSRRNHDLTTYRDRLPHPASGHPLGLWSSLITAGTCILAETHGEIAGCIGWTNRRTHRSLPHLPGGRAASPLDPARTSAQLHALIAHPRWARGGLARRLLRVGERAVREAGFRQLELLATPAEESFYAASGFTPVDRVDIRLSDGLTIATLRMRKGLAPARARTLPPAAGAIASTHRPGDATVPGLVSPRFAPVAAIEHGTDYSL